MNRARASITSVCLAFALAACGGDGGNSSGGSGGDQQGGSGGSQSGGSGGGQGGSGGGGSGGSEQGGAGGSEQGGAGGSENGGSGGSEKGGAGGTVKGGAGGTVKGGAGGSVVGGTTTTPTGQGGNTNPGQTGGVQGNGGSTTPVGTGGDTPPANTLVTSASGNYWKGGTWTEVTSGTADVTVDDTKTITEKWEGFGGAFNEIGWKQLESSKALQDEAIGLLFGKDGCNISWGRIPMGASDYGISRYTYDDTGSDVTPDSSEGNRPPADTSLSKFSIARDEEKLIPYIKAAQAVKPDLRFWASPWTPPVWMKTGYKKDSGGTGGGDAKKPSYFDGGNFKNDSSIISAYAQYYKKFVEAYKAKEINVEVVSPQNEPGYDQNYPSCLWDKTTYLSFVKALGPVMKDLNIKLMLGSMSNAGDNSRNDMDIAAAVLADSTAKGFLSVGGAQWGVLVKLNNNQANFGGLPVWASEHRCGNYPWNPEKGCGDDNDACPKYNSTQAPNDQAYGVESWKYMRNAINKGKVTSYNAWNMVLDKLGLGNDLSRDWRQNSMLVVDGGKIVKTPFYYVFRHLAQYTVPGAKVVTASNSEAIAFKNPDGTVVLTVYSKAGKSNFIVKVAGKMLQFNMPADGWATVVYK